MERWRDRETERRRDKKGVRKREREKERERVADKRRKENWKNKGTEMARFLLVLPSIIRLGKRLIVTNTQEYLGTDLKTAVKVLLFRPSLFAMRN